MSEQFENVSDDYEKLSHTQVNIVVAIGVLNASLLSFTLAFALFNTGAHLIRLKIKKILILLFYLLTYCLMTFRLIDTAETIRKPRLNKFEYNRNSSIGVIFRSAAECALVSLGFLIVVTMY